MDVIFGSAASQTSQVNDAGREGTLVRNDKIPDSEIVEMNGDRNSEIREMNRDRNSEERHQGRDDSLNPVGIFDSGVGGISTLGAMVKLMPEEDFLYYGDEKNAPYGTKATEEVISCVRKVVNELQKDHIKALVIACNTATGAAAAVLRKELTIPVIGIEPALKPASEAGKGGKIMVMATPLTLRQKKFLALMDKYGTNAEPVACHGLMELVEHEDFPGAERYLENMIAGWELDCIDAVVLGCTHYVFLRPMIRKMLPERILITDGNGGTARQLRRVLEQRGLARRSGEETRGNGEEPGAKRAGRIVFKTSGSSERTLPVMQRLLKLALDLEE